MKHIRIVYKISTIAGENIKNNLKKKLKLKCYGYISVDEKILNEVPDDKILICLIAANSVHRTDSHLKEKIKGTVLNKRIKLVSMIDASVEKCKVNNAHNVMLLV